jgi:hypothetical protein
MCYVLFMNDIRLSLDTINNLRLFLTVCNTGSFTLAGASFGLSQPGVSRTIRKPVFFQVRRTGN